MCVCHHHGAVDCPGCPDCEGDEDGGYGDDWDLYEGLDDGFGGGGVLP